MKRNIDIAKILFIITMVLMFLPMLQQFTGLINFKPLKGVTEEVPKPILSFDNYRSGKFQSQAEKYLSDNFGFRQPFIRLYNQYIWSFYHKTNVNTVILGKENWLYEDYFINDYTGKRSLKYVNTYEELKDQMRKTAVRLRKLQEILDEQGKHFFVFVEPGKNRVYPEYIPDRFTKAPDSAVIAADYYPFLFDSLGINCLNMDVWFRQIKDSVDYNLFHQTGTHWSNIASDYAADTLIRYMEHLGGINMTNLVIGEPYIDKVRKPDDDLEQMMNLMFRMYDVPVKNVDVSSDNDSTAVKPRMILIGDSFFWNIAANVPIDTIFETHYYWFYNSTIYFDNAYNNTAKTDIVDQLINTDFVILAACTAQLYNIDWELSTKALTHLCYDQDQINIALNKTVEKMMGSPEWKASLQEKADARGCSLEEMAWNDAIYLLYQNPEKYLDELNDEHPAPRNTILKALSGQDDPVCDAIRSMLSNPKTMDEIKEKSVEKGQSISETLLLDARWIASQRENQNKETPTNQ